MVILHGPRGIGKSAIGRGREVHSYRDLPVVSSCLCIPKSETKGTHQRNQSINRELFCHNTSILSYSDYFCFPLVHRWPSVHSGAFCIVRRGAELCRFASAPGRRFAPAWQHSGGAGLPPATSSHYKGKPCRNVM